MIEIKKDRKGEWRWSVIAPNKQIVGASSEGFKTRSGVLANLRRMDRYLAMGSVTIRGGHGKPDRVVTL